MTTPDLSALRVLIVDDEADIRLGLSRLLEMVNIKAQTAADGRAALDTFEDQDWDLVLSDLMMPRMSGTELLAEIKRHHQNTAVVMLTGFGTVQTAVQCLQAGASHFLTKPFDNQEILSVVGRLGMQILAQQSRPNIHGEIMVAEDPATRQVMALVEKVAGQSVSVLVEGESGTGKEVIASAIHRRSSQSARPFSAVNCAALSDTLLESELFGHVRGAFTGADRDRRGLFVEAAGGTVFLDEVSSMTPAFQGKLLRVLQERAVRPVGGSSDIPVDFRLIAATNRDLAEMVAAGEFREDLYYRLQVVRVHIPPLRERPRDIMPLAMHFLLRSTHECLGADAAPPQLSRDTIQLLESHPWPGNVRELENAMQRAVIVGGGEPVQAFHLGLDSNPWQGGEHPESEAKECLDYAAAKSKVVEDFQRGFVERCLKKTSGNISQAAACCGLTRAAFQKILRQLNIDRKDFS